MESAHLTKYRPKRKCVVIIRNIPLDAYHKDLISQGRPFLNAQMPASCWEQNRSQNTWLIIIAILMLAYLFMYVSSDLHKLDGSLQNRP